MVEGKFKADAGQDGLAVVQRVQSGLRVRVGTG